MNGDTIVYGTAVYEYGKPGEIVVTERDKTEGESFRGPREGPPRIRDLHPTGWQNVPGQDWDADKTGAWHVSVFRHEP